MQREGQDIDQGCPKSFLSAPIPHRLEPALPLLCVKARQRELLPERNQKVVKNVERKDVSLEYYLIPNEINKGATMLSLLSSTSQFPLLVGGGMPPTCAAWPTDLVRPIIVLTSCDASLSLKDLRYIHTHTPTSPRHYHLPCCKHLRFLRNVIGGDIPFFSFFFFSFSHLWKLPLKGV